MKICCYDGCEKPAKVKDKYCVVHRRKLAKEKTLGIGGDPCILPYPGEGRLLRITVTCPCCKKVTVTMEVEHTIKRLPRKYCAFCLRQHGNVDDWVFDGNRHVSGAR